MSISVASSSGSGVSVSAVEKKLKDLNTTIQSIQGVSQWLIHYRKHAKTVVGVWYKEQHRGSLVPGDVPKFLADQRMFFFFSIKGPGYEAKGDLFSLESV